MRVLVACEFSQIVCQAFRARGHEAFSCDILPTEGRPKWHIQDDVLKHLEDGWDLMIAHDPCTYQCNSGVSWLRKDKSRWEKLVESGTFTRRLLTAPIPKIARENPVPHHFAIELIGRKYDQIIQPYWFGHPESKATCLWLKELPLLVPTNKLLKPECGYWANQTPTGQNKLGPSESRWRERSRTYPGIAKAMAEQWG